MKTHRHSWKCIEPGYDSLHECRYCKKRHMESADNPDSRLPEFGCIDTDNYFIWKFNSIITHNKDNTIDILATAKDEATAQKICSALNFKDKLLRSFD